MARATHNRMIEELSGTAKQDRPFNAPAHETENARLDRIGPFNQHAVAAGQSAVALPNGLGTGALTFVTAPRAGEILGIAWGLSTAGTHTAGSVKATVGGTASGDAAAIDGGGTEAVVDQTTPVSFAEGDKLGVEITTDANWTPTPDLAVWLIVRWAA